MGVVWFYDVVVLGWNLLGWYSLVIGMGWVVCYDFGMKIVSELGSYYWFNVGVVYDKYFEFFLLYFFYNSFNKV